MQFGGKNQIDAKTGWLSRLLFALFCLQALCVSANSCQNHWTPASTAWRFLIWIGTASTIASAATRLPWQNVLAASAMVAAVDGTGFLAQIAFPGLGLYIPAADECGFILFLFAVFNARNLGNFILAPRKERPLYGIWLIGWTGLMVALLGIEYSAACKSIMPGKLTNEVIGLTGLAWGMSGVAAVSLASPWFISKIDFRPPPSAQSAFAWFVLNLLLLGVLATHRIWWVFLLGIMIHSALAVHILRTSKPALPHRLPESPRGNKKP